MNSLADLYRKKLNVPTAVFTHIDHEDAMVAAVFKISQQNSTDQILKICSRKEDFLRESYFLNRFVDKIPVPRILEQIQPEKDIEAAILMECVQGDLLKPETVSKALAWEIGTLLACIHRERAEGYGDLIYPSHLSDDPRISFTKKFEEGLEECKNHLSPNLLKICRLHFDKDINLLLCADGPCIIHRDFRPGNIIVANEKVQGIIDWSSGRGGFAEEDFCSWECGEWPKKHKTSFLNGYASIRKIPDYQHLMPLLRLKKAVASVGFTLKRETWKSKHSKFYESNLWYLEYLLK